MDWGRVRWENVGKLVALAAAGALLIWGWRDDEAPRPAAPERRRLPPPAEPVQPVVPAEPPEPRPRRRRMRRRPPALPELPPPPAPPPQAPVEPPPPPRHGEFTPDPG